MKQSLSFLATMAQQLIEKAQHISDISLWNGKMGTAIFLFHVARIMQNKEYETQACEFVDDVYNYISNQNIPFYFNNGLLGIGCGFEYIIEQKFMDGDSDEVLREIDQIAKYIINMRPINKIDLKEGICGVGFYIYCRLKHKQENDESMTTLFLKEYLVYLIDWIEELLLKTTGQKDYNDVYFLLCRLQTVNVLNFKVEKLICLCLHRMVNFNSQFIDNYENLGINYLNTIKLWI